MATAVITNAPVFWRIRMYQSGVISHVFRRLQVCHDLAKHGAGNDAWWEKGAREASRRDKHLFVNALPQVQFCFCPFPLQSLARLSHHQKTALQMRSDCVTASLRASGMPDYFCPYGHALSAHLPPPAVATGLIAAFPKITFAI